MISITISAEPSEKGKDLLLKLAKTFELLANSFDDLAEISTSTLREFKNLETKLPVDAKDTVSVVTTKEDKVATKEDKVATKDDKETITIGMCRTLLAKRIQQGHKPKLTEFAKGLGHVSLTEMSKAENSQELYNKFYAFMLEDKNFV